MDLEERKKETETDSSNIIWSIVLGAFTLVIKMTLGVLNVVFKGLFENSESNIKKTNISEQKKHSGKKDKMTAYDILLARGYSEKEASRAIRNCQRDLEMAMDDGAMEELEDIVVEDLGVDSSHVEELI